MNCDNSLGYTHINFGKASNRPKIRYNRYSNNIMV